MSRYPLILIAVLAVAACDLGDVLPDHPPEGEPRANGPQSEDPPDPLPTDGPEEPRADTPLAAYAVVDTNQQTCFDATSATDCPEAGAFLGQDAQYAGLQPAYQDNGDGSVTDLNTGLTWTQEVLPKVTFEQAHQDAGELRTGGHSDWRVPSIKELYSLMDFSGGTGMSVETSIPFIDTEYFDFDYGDESAGERMIDAQYWSTTEYVSTTMGGDPTAFGVNFAHGRIKGYPITSPRGENLLFVRYVRGNADYGQNDFVADVGLVFDRATGLTWQQADAGEPLSWEDALAYCEALEMGGHADWRLPDAKALQSIVDYNRSPETTESAAIDPVFGVSDIESYYWSSTTHRDGPPDRWGGSAVYVTFGRGMGFMRDNWIDVHGAGSQRSDPKTGNPDDYPEGHGPQGDDIRIFNHVRCVRGGAEHAEGVAAPEQPQAEPGAQPEGGAPEGGAPPEEAIAACEGAEEGDACDILTPDGQELSGTCASIGGSLACVPEGGPGAGQGEERPAPEEERPAPEEERPAPEEGNAPEAGEGPPQEALTACADLAANDACSIETPHGTLDGTCQSIAGDLACVPANGPEGMEPPQDGQEPPQDGQEPPEDGQGPPEDGQGPPQDGQGPPAEATAACAAQSAGDACSFETPRGDRLEGSCESIQGTLACVPAGGPPGR